MSKTKFALRIDEKLYTVLKRWADDEFRSINGQVEFLLRQAALKAGRIKPLPPPEPESIDETD